ncbi:MAG: MATE family efflux transporter [Gemmatimonadaceae bacterium]|nr:MATE family efflux transporter [Gemmatimonadaceae bacterium]
MHAGDGELLADPQEGVVGVAVSGARDTHDVLSGDLPAVVRRVALPAVASNLLMTLFASADAYWVGTRIGPSGLAAVSTAVFWVWGVVSIAEMVSIGLTAVAARRYGEGRPDEAARTAGDALLLALAIGAVIAVAGFFAVDQMFAVMGTPPDVTALGRRYLQTYFLGAPLIYGFFAVDAAFRASGDTRTPLALLATSVVVTLMLDPVLILGWFGAPALGITGAAVALVGTRGSAFAIGLWLLNRRGMIRWGAPRWAVLGTIARVGLPTALWGVVFSMIYVLMTRTTTQFGTPALAALGIGHRIESWLHMVGVGFGAAAAAIVGQNLGAGQPERARRAGWLTTWYATIPGLVFAACLFVVPQFFASRFTSDVAVIAEATSYLRIIVPAVFVLTAELVLEGALGGAGDTIPPMLTSTTLTVIRVPLAAWAASRFGVDGIWWVISLTATGRGVAMMALWKWGRWAEKRV